MSVTDFVAGIRGDLATRPVDQVITDAATVFANRVGLAMLAVIATPFAQPLAIAAGRCWSEGET